jgi:hypothetical protein
MKNIIERTAHFIMLIILPVVLYSQSKHYIPNFNQEIYDNFSSEAENAENHHYLNPLQSILVGIPAGCLLGIIIGTQIYATSYDEMLNAVRAAVIGMSVMPFVHYEINRKVKGINNSLNRWSVAFGSNITYTDYDDASIQRGFTAALNRYYFLNKQFDMIYGLTYAHYKFMIPDKIIKYYYFDLYKIADSDIHFSAHYLNMSILVNCKFNIIKFPIHFGIGPFISVQFLDKTSYSTHWEEYLYGIDTGYDCDYSYSDDEVTGTLPVAGWALNLGFIMNPLIVQVNYRHSFDQSNHIFGLFPETALSALELTLGIYGK